MLRIRKVRKKTKKDLLSNLQMSTNLLERSLSMKMAMISYDNIHSLQSTNLLFSEKLTVLTNLIQKKQSINLYHHYRTWLYVLLLTSLINLLLMLIWRILIHQGIIHRTMHFV